MSHGKATGINLPGNHATVAPARLSFLPPWQGSHELWVRDRDGRVVPIPHHRGKSIRKGTVGAIIKEAGVSVDEFMKL